MSRGDSFLWGCKADRGWGWPLSFFLCQEWECVRLYLHFPYVFTTWCLMKHGDKLACLVRKVFAASNLQLQPTASCSLTHDTATWWSATLTWPCGRTCLFIEKSPLMAAPMNDYLDAGDYFITIVRSWVSLSTELNITFVRETSALKQNPKLLLT
jgi:hypothetical protein